MRITINKLWALFALLLISAVASESALAQQSPRSPKSYVRGGMLIQPDTSAMKGAAADSTLLAGVIDSLALDSLALDSIAMGRVPSDSLTTESLMPRDATDSLLMAEAAAARGDSLSMPLPQRGASPIHTLAREEEKVREPFISDSMSISKMSWISAALPGFGQVYNKQYWKLPILYGTLGAGIALYVNENKTYQPLKTEYNNLLLEGVYRTTELDEIQGQMIKSNTRRQLYLGLTAASYIYFLGDAAVNYSTNDVSDVKKATTLAMICPGAGQIYNKSYWRVPFVVGLFATTIYVIDWNNRGYLRFQQAYTLTADYEANPDNYPNGSVDEFGGKYSASYLKSLRDSYRRNRDYAIILTAGVYLLQIIDAHVDAHLKTFDISDDLTLNFSPTVDYTYVASYGSDTPVYGLNLNFKF